MDKLYIEVAGQRFRLQLEEEELVQLNKRVYYLVVEQYRTRKDAYGLAAELVRDGLARRLARKVSQLPYQRQRNKAVWFTFTVAELLLLYTEIKHDGGNMAMRLVNGKIHSAVHDVRIEQYVKLPNF